MNPKLLGILNLSPDSFSDGGRYTALPAAIAHGEELARHGAWAVDVGAVSSNPEGKNLSPEQEIARLRPVVRALKARQIRVSLDSFSPLVQAEFADSVDILNDIRGFPEPTLYPLLARSSCTLVVMHSVQRGRADRRQTEPSEVIEGMFAFFEQRLGALQAAGVPRSRLIVDPGMGFFLGATPEPSVAVLQQIQALRDHTGCEVLISVSRKSFLGALLSGREVSDRSAATLAAELYAVAQGASWIRTHDVLSLQDALTITSTLFGTQHPVQG